MRAAGVSFRYGRRSALRDASLEVASGQVVALVGPNGAGKSTLLRLLAGDLAPGGGRVDGPPAREVGYAADESVHLDALTVRENARFFARASGAADGEIDRLLEHFALAAEADNRAAELSFGQRRKLALVEALAPGPRLLLLDEPTVGLDAAAVASLVHEVAVAAARGAAVVLASNDLPAAEALAHRVVLLHQGRIVADATPAVLLARAGAATRIEVDAPAPRPADVAFPPGVAARPSADGWLLEVDGTSVLPAVCATLHAAGVQVRALRVRAPGLADAFTAVTGVPWGGAPLGTVGHAGADAGRRNARPVAAGPG